MELAKQFANQFLNSNSFAHEFAGMCPEVRPLQWIATRLSSTTSAPTASNAHLRGRSSSRAQGAHHTSKNVAIAFRNGKVTRWIFHASRSMEEKLHHFHVSNDGALRAKCSAPAWRQLAP